jgi:hypothetical protein
MTNQQPNPYTYPCFVLKETICDDAVTQSERHTFSDLQLAYIWAKEDTGQEFNPDVREGRQGNWSYTSFECLRDWLADDSESGYRVFKLRYDATYYTEYLIYYDIPQEQLHTSQNVEVVLPAQPVQIPILPLNTLPNINSNLSILTNDQLDMINNLTNALLNRYNRIH